MSFDYGDENNLNLKTIVVLGRMILSMDGFMGKSITSTGLTVGQFAVLEALYHKGPMTVNQVIEKTLSSSGNMGVVIDNLVKNGMVVKTVDEQDKRSRILELSEQGKKLIKDYFPEHLEVLADCLSGLENHEKKQLIELSKKLGKSVGQKKNPRNKE